MKSKVPEPSLSRQALASNLRHLMNSYKLGVGIKPRGIEESSRGAISYKTVERILDLKNDIKPRLETLDELANFFGVETWQLLRPHHEAARPNNHPKHSGTQE